MAMPPRPQVVPGVVDSGGCRRAVTPVRPRLAAHKSGVRLWLSGFLGLTSSRPSSISTAPSFPFSPARRSVQRRLSGLSGVTSSPPAAFSPPLVPILGSTTKWHSTVLTWDVEADITSSE